MAEPFRKNNRWYLRFKDAHGRWRQIPSDAESKTEARRLAVELRRRHERARLGIEEAPPEDGGGTVDELLAWWVDAYLAKSPGFSRAVGTVRKHLIGSKLGGLTLVELTPGRIESFLQEKVGGYSPQTLNHIRAYLGRAFSAARKTDHFRGPNPVSEVKKRRIPKTKPDFLRSEEVLPVLAALPDRWRTLFATALYTGLRKGELLGLRKSSVDVENKLLTVAYSYGRDTTKGGHADVIPIASELVPYLREAIARSPSEMMFPAPGGSMMSDRVQLELVLRRALRRAGIVTGWLHKCRRQRCGHVEAAQDDQLRRCPKCTMKLWPAAQVRPIRFHHLRHTTASLLLMRGADVSAVQKILRHTDPRLTTETYGHLVPDYLRAQIDRLSFGPARPASVPTVSNAKHPSSTISPPFAPILLPEAENLGKSGRPRDHKTESSRALELGRGERIRTSDILLPKQARYQAAPRPVFSVRRVYTTRGPLAQVDIVRQPRLEPDAGAAHQERREQPQRRPHLGRE
jgi:integrase